MQALGWDEETRKAQRRNWYRAEVNARDWFVQHLPDPSIWLSWDESAQTALRYLETRLDSMDDALFKAKGYPIGSGQVEAMNKSVIGHRMKRSGSRSKILSILLWVSDCGFLTSKCTGLKRLLPVWLP